MEHARCVVSTHKSKNGTDPNQGSIGMFSVSPVLRSTNGRSQRADWGRHICSVGDVLSCEGPNAKRHGLLASRANVRKGWQGTDEDRPSG